MSDIDSPQERSSHSSASFSGDVLKLVSGTTVALMIGVLTSPVIARLFGPEPIGIFALLSSITGIFASVFTLEYELAIMLPKDIGDSANLLVGTIGISSLFSLLTVPLVWFCGPSVAHLLNAPLLAKYLWLVPLLLFFGGVTSGHPALNIWAGRTHRFTQISITRITGTITSAVATLVVGLAGFNTSGGLIAGSIVGSIVTPLMLGWQILRQDYRLFLETVRFSKIWENLKHYHKFALYSTPSALMNTVSWQAPSFLLSAFFSTATVGFFALSNQLLNVPMNLIGASFSQAFFSHATIANRDGVLATFVESTFCRLVEYSFFPILMLAVIGKDLFLVVFGTRWVEAGVYVQILSLWMVFWFVSSPMSQLVNVLEKNEFFFRWNIVALVTRVSSIWVGGILGSSYLAMIFYSVSGALVYGYLSVWIIMKAGCSWRRISKSVLQNLVIFAPAGGAVFLLKLVQPFAWVSVVVSIFLVCIYYIYRFKDEYQLRRILLRVKNLIGKVNL
ncbi:MAG TPA: oligosaccharide flippase family protein [Anaerolineales bacterium]|nr:oligosaccharide flippase family protein [Anaerolineales bacterium]